VDFSLPALLFAAITGVLGLALGSFANVLAYRVPAGMSLLHPPSACPNCGHAIRSRHNLPVIGWLMLRGRCFDCHEPISAFYPAIEAMAGIVATLLGFWAWQQVPPAGTWPVGFDPLLFTLLPLLTVAAALVVTDITTMRLPNSLTYSLYPIIVIGLALAAWLTPWGSGSAPWVRVLASGGAWLLVYAGLAAVGPLVLGRESMGLGDVKLAPALGLVLGWVGWGASLTGLLAGFVVGAIVGIAFRVSRGRPFPFGPALLAGALIGLLAGQAIGGWYGGLLGV
jgi:leader peptidase (prepilin peptidase) / N-methyltransferase